MQKHILKAFIAIIAVSFSVKPALSDDEPSVFQAAEIRNAFITPGDAGETSILRFHIRNNSADNLVILGVKGPDHKISKVTVQLGSEKYSDLGSIPLLPEEYLDMTSSHMFVRLQNVIRPMEPNGKIKLRLILANGRLPFSAHVRKQKIK